MGILHLLKIAMTSKDKSVDNSNYGRLWTNQENRYRWQEMSCDQEQPMPVQRNKHAMCLSGGAIYIHGGRDRSIVHKDLWKYTLATSTWERVTSTGEIPRLLQEHTMVAYKNKLYIFGGDFSTGSDNESPLWILDLDIKVWRKHRVKGEVMTPQGRRGHSALVFGNQMVIYGGYLDMRGSNSELWLFDLDVEMWHLAHSGEAGPGGRHGHSAVLRDKSMWVAGGMCDLQPRSDIWYWHFGVHSWCKVRCKNSPPELHGHTACVLHDLMVLVGGESQWQLQPDVWVFSFNSLTWQKMRCEGDSPSARSHHSCIAVPRYLLDRQSSLSLPTLKSPSLVSPDDVARPCTSPPVVVSDKNASSPRKTSYVSYMDSSCTQTTNPTQHSSTRITSPSCSSPSVGSNSHIFKNKISPSSSFTSVHPICEAVLDEQYDTQGSNICSIDSDISDFSDTAINERDGALHIQNDSVSRDGVSLVSNPTGKLIKRSAKCLASGGENVLDVIKHRSHSASETRPLVTEISDAYDSSNRDALSFENPIFFMRVNPVDQEPASPSPRKRLRQSLDSLDEESNMVQKKGPSLASVDNRIRSKQSGALPGVVKSGSLDSLLQILGGVTITYIELDDPDPKETMVVEDIENFSVADLELNHNDSQELLLSADHNELAALQEAQTHNTERGNTTTDKKEKKHVSRGDDKDCSQSARSRGERGSCERAQVPLPPFHGLDNHNINAQLLTKDFTHMSVAQPSQGQAYELQTFQEGRNVGLKMKHEPQRVPDVFVVHRPTHSMESVATGNDTGISMLLCGGRESQRKSCDILPMPMWRFDIL